MRIKQSCFLLKLNGKYIWIDPYGIPENMQKADIILITHGHFDHNARTATKHILKDTTTIIYPKKVGRIRRRWKRKANTIGIEPFEEIKIEGIHIQGFPMYNTDGLLWGLIKFHRKKKDLCGYIISNEKHKIYHAGDTDVIPEMKKLRKKNLDFALLPIGGTFTMNPEAAIRATKFIHPKIMIPMHNRMKELDEFKKQFTSEISDIEILSLQPGECISDKNWDEKQYYCEDF